MNTNLFTHVQRCLISVVKTVNSIKAWQLLVADLPDLIHYIMLRSILKFLLLFFVFSILFVLPNVIIPLHVAMQTSSEYNGLMIFILLLTQTAIILYLISRLNLSGVKLFFTVTIVFWGLQTYMPQTETWYFIEAMPAINDAELFNLFLRPLITSFTFIPVAMVVMGKWKANTHNSEIVVEGNLNWKQMLILSATYVVIYFVFGHFIAWQFEDVRIFYSGSSVNAGFIGQLKNNFQNQPFIFFFQFLRGFLWIIIGLPVLLYLKGSKREKIIACILLYALPAIQLIVDNPFVPQQVRVAHLLEVSTSNGLFGWLIGYFSTRR